MTASTNYVAADIADTALAAWTPNLLSADAELWGEKEGITARARDMVRNNPVAAGNTRTLVDNVIGSQLKLSSRPAWRLLGQSIEWAHDWGNRWQDEFATWGDTTECDAVRRLNFLGLTRQAMAGTYVNGDHFAIPQWLPRPDGRWSTRLQLIEADRVATPPFKSADPRVRDGIEVNDYGEPVAGWILKQHPGDRFSNVPLAEQNRWQRVPFFTPWGRPQLIQMFNQQRSGQTRGVSIFAPVMRELKVSWDYLNNELKAAAVNSLIAFFLESDLSQEEVANIFGVTPNQNADIGDNGQQARMSSQDARWQTIVDRMNRRKLESGMITALPLGAKIHEHNFSRPNTSFDPFMEVINRLIGVGINLPFELANNNFSKTNYSSARAALAEAWRFFLCERSWVDATWLNPILECVLEESMNAGRIEAPGFYANKHAYLKCRWIHAGRGAIDPYKEARAKTESLTNGTTTLEREFEEQGEDWEDAMEQRKRENAKAEELGLPLPYPLVASGANGQTKPIDPELDDENGDPLDDEDVTDE